MTRPMSQSMSHQFFTETKFENKIDKKKLQQKSNARKIPLEIVDFFKVFSSFCLPFPRRKNAIIRRSIKMAQIS
jgi:hypothetical protein